METTGDDGPRNGAEALDDLLLAPVAGESMAAQVAEERPRRRETALRAGLEGLPDATGGAGRGRRVVFVHEAAAAARAGDILLVNERAAALLGYRAEELTGRPVGRLGAERVRERYRRNADLYFQTEHPLRFSTKVEGLRSDGSEFVGEMSWGIVETEAGALLLAIGRDISDRRAAMARLRRQSDQHAAIAALGERALAGADLGDLAAEAIERMAATLPVSHIEIRGAGEPLAAWGEPAAAAPEMEIRMGAVGELLVVPTEDELLGEDEQSFLRAVATVLAGAMERRRGEERMRHEALHDPLTGLANRTLCRDRIVHALARAGRGSGGACVLFLDLDAFKRVNDVYGHAAGDELLVALARRLVATVRPADTVARLGGDEFVVVCEEIDEDTAVAPRPPPTHPGGGPPLAPRPPHLPSPPLPSAPRSGPPAPSTACPPASGSRSARAPTATPTRCWPTPTRRPTGPRPRAAGGWRCSTGGSATTRTSGCARPRRSSRRSRSGSCGWPSSRSWRSRTARSSATRRCCAGTGRVAARPRPRTSSRSPRSPR